MFKDSNTRLVDSIAVKIILLAVFIGLSLRVAFMCMPATTLQGVSFVGFIKIFVFGALNDAFVATLALLPLLGFCLSTGHWKLERPQNYYILGALALAWVLLRYAAKPLEEFNRSLHDILCWVMLFWIATFALRALVPSIRSIWVRLWTSIIIGIYLILLVFNAVGEWLFWDEFGVRYNFIAVDYLIYTTEVVGNIRESYNIPAIIVGILAVAGAAEWLLFRKDISKSAELWQPGWRLPVAGVYAGGFAVSLAALPLLARAQTSDNVYANELEASGIYCFYRAFSSNELDYCKFYMTNPDSQVLEYQANQLRPTHANDTLPELQPNIILITLESMSAAYMQHFGDTTHMTPALDSLYKHSLSFDRMFATGNRTVRGLEALTLSRPPAPGESIIKRPDNQGFPSIADILTQRGYHLNFAYGGDSYFDNMESFFSGMGYDIVDSKTFDPSRISHRTIWGICDGDVYAKVLEVADQENQDSKPFFIHMLSTSNHRPYTYPDGKVSIPPSEKKREGAIMYSDYALGEFIDQARQHPWFDNTVFVISADHCASSAGSVDLPLSNYHIPALIYSPTMIEPQTVSKTMSQIDLMPTLFGLLNWDYSTPMYGKNVLDEDYAERAFLATYQDLGYLQDDTLTVLSPGRKAKQFAWSHTNDDPFAITQIDKPSASALQQAISPYQSSATRR